MHSEKDFSLLYYSFHIVKKCERVAMSLVARTCSLTVYLWWCEILPSTAQSTVTQRKRLNGTSAQEEVKVGGH